MYTRRASKALSRIHLDPLEASRRTHLERRVPPFLHPPPAAFMALARPTITSLSFGAKDLTDTYADSRSTTSQSTTANRHPRGDSPLHLSPSLSPSSTRSGGVLRELPNLNSLLAFLDEDDPPPEQHNNPSLLLASPSHPIASSSAPLQTSTPPFPAPESFHSFPSPSVRIQSRGRSAMSFSAELGGPTSLGRESRSGRVMGSALGGEAVLVGREEGSVGGSPSPRPGSASLLLGRGGKGKGREEGFGEELEEVESSEKEYDPQEARSDSVTRLADEVRPSLLACGGGELMERRR